MLIPLFSAWEERSGCGPGSYCLSLHKYFIQPTGHLLPTCTFSSGSFHCATVCSPLTNQCSVLFWLSVQLSVLQFFSHDQISVFGNDPILTTFHLFNSYFLINSLSAIVHTCHSTENHTEVESPAATCPHICSGPRG